MAKNRKSRDKVRKKVDITKPLQPIDILKFGTDDDPCFGKYHDLTEDECKRCGDSSICSIVCNQVTIGLREEQESTKRFKDLELVKGKDDNKEIKKFIKDKTKKGVSALKITKQLVSKFSLDKSDAKKLVKKYKP